MRGIHPVEVVNIVAAHEEEQGVGEELERIARPSRPKAHGVVEPGAGLQRPSKPLPKKRRRPLSETPSTHV